MARVALISAALVFGATPVDAHAGPVIVAALVSATATAVVQGFTWAIFAKAFVTSLITNVVLGALSGKRDGAAQMPAVDAFRSRSQTVRSTTEPRKLVYGEVLLSGPVLFAANDASNEYRYMVVPLATHRVEAMVRFYFNDELVGPREAAGYVTSGRFGDDARIQVRLGSLQQVANADFITELPDQWRSSDRGRGVADMYVRTTTSGDVYPNGWIAPRAVVRGRRLYDPRAATVAITSSSVAAPGVFTTGAVHGLAAGDEIWVLNHSGSVPAVAKRYEVNTVPTTTTFTLLGPDGEPLAITTGGTGGTLSKCLYSRNPTLVRRDYLCDPRGQNCDDDEINSTDCTASANADDERVSVVYQPTITIDTTDDLVLFATAQNQLNTGDAVVYTSSGGAAGGLTSGNLYYFIRESAAEGQLATTRANALAGTAIDLTSSGSGTQTLERRVVFTASATDDEITFEIAENRLDTGDGVIVESAGTLPAGLSALTTYYAIRTGATTCQLATSVANATAGTAIDITDAGTGVHRLRHVDQTRYTFDGTVDLSYDPQRIIEELNTACAGTVVYSAGKFRILSGYYRTPTGTLTKSSQRGDIAFRTRPQIRDLYNAVRGTYVDPHRHWQPQEFPPLRNSTYVTQDNEEEIFRDIVLPGTTNQLRAQRIAKIHLEKSRQGMTMGWPCKLSEFEHDVWDVTEVTLAQMGFSGKDFLVTGWKLSGLTNVDLTLQEEASASYDWAAGDATAADPAPDTELQSPFDDLDIAGLALASGTAQLLQTNDGTVISRIRVSWTAAANGFVTNNGHILVQYKKTADSVWIDAPPVAGDQTQTWIAPVDDGVSYSVRARSETSLGNRSDWSSTVTHTVAGKTAVPSDVEGFVAQQVGAVVQFGCTPVEDADLDRVEIRLLDDGDTTWENGVARANILRGQTLPTVSIPPGTWTFLAKAFDTSGNESANAAQFDLEVTAEGYTEIVSREESPDWPGTLTNFVRHPLGALVPDDQNLASSYGWEVFDEFVPTPYATCTYEAAELDKSIDGSARVYVDVVSSLGPGEVTGQASPAQQIDYKTTAGSYDGFEDWTVGTPNFRYVKSKLILDTSVGVAKITGMHTVVDNQARTESGTATTPGGGSVAVTFATPFHATPILQVTPQGSGNVTASYASLTATGFTAYFKTGGSAAAGTVSYTATGP